MANIAGAAHKLEIPIVMPPMKTVAKETRALTIDERGPSGPTRTIDLFKNDNIYLDIFKDSEQEITGDVKVIINLTEMFKYSETDLLSILDEMSENPVSNKFYLAICKY